MCIRVQRVDRERGLIARDLLLRRSPELAQCLASLHMCIHAQRAESADAGYAERIADLILGRTAARIRDEVGTPGGAR